MLIIEIYGTDFRDTTLEKMIRKAMRDFDRDMTLVEETMITVILSEVTRCDLPSVGKPLLKICGTESEICDLVAEMLHKELSSSVDIVICMIKKFICAR